MSNVTPATTDAKAEGSIAMIHGWDRDGIVSDGVSDLISNVPAVY